MHRIIKFNQKVWLKLCIDLNTDLRKNVKNDFEEDFFKLMNNKVLKKTVKNVIKHRDFKFPTAEARRNYLVSEPNYRPKISFSWKFMSNKDSNTHK